MAQCAAPPDLPSPEGTFRTLDAETRQGIPRTVRTLLRHAQAMQLNLTELNDARNPADRLITRELVFTPPTPGDTAAETVRDSLQGTAPPTVP